MEGQNKKIKIYARRFVENEKYTIILPLLPFDTIFINKIL